MKGIIKTESCLITDPENIDFSFALELGDAGGGLFTDGMRFMSEFYGLTDTHKAYFKYVGSNCFWIRICTLDGKEIDYPKEGFDTDIDESFLNYLLPSSTGLL